MGFRGWLATSTYVGGMLFCSVALSLPLNPDQLSESPRMRPCCDFGIDLRVRVLSIPLPIVIHNIFDLANLQTHSYTGRELFSGPIFSRRGLQVQEILEEIYGIAYSCRGGFLDLGHVSDIADWTAYIGMQIYNHGGESGIIELPFDGGTMSIIVTDLPFRSRYELREIAMTIAQRIAYQTSLVHEMMTWYDYASIPFLTEKSSAFSPEDLYSNLLGTYVGKAAVMNENDYDSAATAEIRRRFEDLDALSGLKTKLAFLLTDGIWWDSARKFPDFRMVLKRNLGSSSLLTPWRVDLPGDLCSGEAVAPLEIPWRAHDGQSLEKLYDLEFKIRSSSVNHAFPIPSRASGGTSNTIVFGPDDFELILAIIREDILKELGPDSDRVAGSN